MPANLDARAAAYEFEVAMRTQSFGVPAQFALADGPFDTDGGAPKNIYWFYVDEFAKP